jgi:hypothetical protein
MVTRKFMLDIIMITRAECRMMMIDGQMQTQLTGTRMPTVDDAHHRHMVFAESSHHLSNHFLSILSPIMQFDN